MENGNDIDPLEAYMKTLNDNEDQHFGNKKKMKKMKLINLKRKRIKKPLPERIDSKVRLHEGLATNILQSGNNKGLKLLERMGFKQGQGLGRASDGIKEPLPLYLDGCAKSGIGIKRKRMEEHREKEKVKQLKTDIKQSNAAKIRTNFRNNLSSKFENKRILMDLEKSKSVCETLDIRIGIDDNLIWFIKNDSADDALDTAPGAGDTKYTISDEASEMVRVPKYSASLENEQLSGELNTVLIYLREKHYYCFYCGTCYENEEDLNQICPGVTRDAH